MNQSTALRSLTVGAREIASKGLDGVTDATAEARKTVGHYADATGRYVSQEPLKSALIAAAVGALVAALVVAAVRRNG